MSEIKKQPVVLILADGFGLSPAFQSNAIASANPTNFFDLWKNYRHLIIRPDLSECENIYQTYTTLATGLPCADYTKNINLSKEQLSGNHQLMMTLDSLKRNNASLHLIGCISEKNKNKTIKDLVEIIKFAKSNSILNTSIHLIIDETFDGVTPLNTFLADLEKELDNFNYGKIATIVGKNVIAKENYKKYFATIYRGRGKSFFSARQAISNLKNMSVADLNPSLIKSHQNQHISNSDTIIFFTSPDETISTMIREMIIINKDKSSSAFPSFLTFYAVSEFPFDLRDEINYLSNKRSADYISDILQGKGISQTIVTDQLNLPNINCFLLGNSQFVDEKIVQVPSDPSTKKYKSTTKAITDLVLDQINKNSCDYTVINFPSLYRFYLECSFNDCVKEVKLLDEAIASIDKAVRSKQGFLIFVSTFGGAETVAANSNCDANGKFSKNSAAPFLMISDVTKSVSNSSLLNEILYAKSDLTIIHQALKIILLGNQ